MPTNNVKSLFVRLGSKASLAPTGEVVYPTSITVINMGRTVWGNKKVVFADLVLGDGAEIWPQHGCNLTPQNFGLVGIDSIIFNGGQAYYKWSSNVLDAYVCGTAGATHVFVKASGSTINETVRVMVIGYGMQP